MTRIGLTGLLKIELPDRTLRFCDGGFIEYEGEMYRGEDEIFGTIGQLRTMAESVGDIVPALTVTLLPPDTTAAIEISQPGNQTARARIIIAEYDPETGLPITGRTEFDGQLDQTVLTAGGGRKDLTASIVSLGERLFERNIGNTMNPQWHKSNFPGELGHDNATGLGRPVAWGTEAPGGGQVFGGGGNSEPPNRNVDFR
jgi:hypothetical protein